MTGRHALIALRPTPETALVPFPPSRRRPAPRRRRRAGRSDDPYLWLEEVEGKRALDQVKEWNAATEALLTADPKYESYRQRALAHPRRQGADRHSRPDRRRQGRQPVARRDQPARPVADLAARRLSRRQAAMADPDRRRRARQGGGQVLGLARRRLPRARLSPLPRLAEPRRHRRRRGPRVRPRRPAGSSRTASSSPRPRAASPGSIADTLLVGTDYGAGLADRVGLSADRQIVEARHSARVGAHPVRAARPATSASIRSPSRAPTRRWVFVDRGKTFWTNERHLLTPTGGLIPVPHAGRRRARGRDRRPADRQAAEPARALSAPERSSPSRFATSSPEAMPSRELVMAPTAKQAIEEVSASDNVLWVKALDDVSGKLFALTPRKRRRLDRRGRSTCRPTAPSICSPSAASRTSPSPPSRGC